MTLGENRFHLVLKQGWRQQNSMTAATMWLWGCSGVPWVRQWQGKEIWHSAHVQSRPSKTYDHLPDKFATKVPASLVGSGGPLVWFLHLEPKQSLQNKYAFCRSRLPHVVEMLNHQFRFFWLINLLIIHSPARKLWHLVHSHSLSDFMRTWMCLSNRL